jgi:hypothetical protein
MIIMDLNKSAINQINFGAIINYPLDKNEWTLNKIIDELYMQLISTIDKDGITLKYENQARYLIRRIPILKPIPTFMIYLNDLSVKLKEQLKKLAKIDPKFLDKIMRRTIEIIFNDIEETHEDYFNKKYFWLCIKRYGLLRWKFV